jgi:hypothetical protein
MTDFSALAKYFSGPVKPAGPSVKDVANYILLNSDMSKGIGPGTLKQDNSPSIMSRIFDILSRPNYAIANTVKDVGHGTDDPFSSFISGLAGTQKTTFQDVLKDAGLPESVGRAGLGLALDVGLDPTTYIPGGILGKIGKVVGIGGKVAEGAAKDLPLAAKIAGKESAIAGEVPEALKNVPTAPPVDIRDALAGFENTVPKADNLLPKQLQLPFEYSDIERALNPDLPKVKSLGPEVAPEVAPAAKVATGEVKGQIPLKFPGLNIRETRAAVKAAQRTGADAAPKILEKIASGSDETLLKTLPVPKPKITPEIQKLAESALKGFDPKRATAVINKQFPNTLNAKQQVALWYRARNAVQSKVFRKGRDDAKISTEVAAKAAPVYHAMENTLRAAGYVPRIGTGDNVALSDVVGDLLMRGHPVDDSVLREFGSEITPGSPLHAAIERVRARGVIQDSPHVGEIVDAVASSKAATKTGNALSDAQQFNFDKFLKGFADKTARTMGLSPAATKATGSMVDAALKSGKSPAQIAVEGMRKELDDVIARGGASPKANKALTLGLEKNLGKLPKYSVNDNKALEFLMGRVVTWWGQKDLRPLSLVAAASSSATAAARGKALDNMFKGFNAAQRLEAFRAAQGIGPVNTQEVATLAQGIQQTMDNLLGQAMGASVLLRSGVNMDMLNGWMKRYGTGFQFHKGRVKDPISGVEHDFSQGSDWVNSWKMHDLGEKDPADWMFKTMQALEQSTREKALFDEMGERFGSTHYGKEFTTKIDGHPYLEGYYFPTDIAKQIPRVVKDWTLPVGSSNKYVQLYDRALSMWKSGVTIYRPAHHIRNLVGDLYMGALDGVVSVVPYKHAVQVQKAMGSYAETMQDVDKLVELGMVSRGLETPTPGRTLFRNKSGVGFTAEQVGALAHQQGLLEHVKTLEDIIDLGERGGFSITRPLAGKGQKLARTVSEMQGHNARLAHFIDKLMKSRGSDLTKIVPEAARRARKYHPSGIDLTHFEKTVMRRIIPFYSWLRKSTPVLLEGLVMKPGITVLPAKVGEALQQANGIDTTRDNPFPTDQLFPKWIRDEGIGPISLPDGFLGNFSNQLPPGYVQAGVGLNPLSQLLTQLQDPGRTIGSSLSPVVQIPTELITGRKVFTGEPIRGPEAKPGAFGEYVGSQIPIFNAVQGISGLGLAGQTNKSIKSDNQAGKENLINWLTGLGIKGTGPYMHQANYERIAPRQAEQKAKKQEFLASLRDYYGG